MRAPVLNEGDDKLKDCVQAGLSIARAREMDQADAVGRTGTRAWGCKHRQGVGGDTGEEHVEDLRGLGF